MDNLNYIWQELLRGNLEIAYQPNSIGLLQSEALRILDTPVERMTGLDNSILDVLIKISNIIYNNVEMMPPIEDGIYDKLMVRYKTLNPETYQIGGSIVNFNVDDMAQMDAIDNMKVPVIFEDQSIREGIYYEDLRKDPPINIDLLDQRDQYFRSLDPNNIPILKKSNVVVPHKYPKLVGTLDKCKFVLNKEAIEAGCFDDPDVTIFERDFLGKHLMTNIINPYEPFTLLMELKYDGMSVEADCTNIIKNARSRGDTNQDLAEDLTPVLGGYIFPNAPEIPDTEAFGIKFEAIITKYNLYKLGMLKGKTYKNSRNGIVGLMKSNDAIAYRDLITLVPLETSLDLDPITEIAFMNQYFTNDVYLKYAVASGSYNEVLYQVYRFVKEAEAIRDTLPFMYDGVVVHYIDHNIRARLGRVNSVNQYSIAIKFNPMSKECIFTGFDFTVGQNGVITPVIYHTPVEFFGTIHPKSSGHSLQRFNELNLAIGDIIEVTYRNDVMPYITRKVSNHYENGVHNPVPFPTNCPSCGTRLTITDSGKSAICLNFNCPGRVIARITNMMKKLNLKGFSEMSLKKMGVTSFTDMLSISSNPMRAITALGEVNGKKFVDLINGFFQTRIDDFRVVGSLGFTDVAIESWKKILSDVAINDLIFADDANLVNMLMGIRGIGRITAETIVAERKFFTNDLVMINQLGNIITNFHAPKKTTIRFTGCRPTPEFAEYLFSLGYDANPDGTVTKSTDILVVPEVGFTSSKTKKCGDNTMIVDYDEFIKNTQWYLDQRKSLM